MLADKLSKKYLQLIFIFFTALATFALQYSLRSYDDNRLTSWKWAFANENMLWYFPVIAAAVLIFYFAIKYYSARPALFLTVISFISSTFFWSVPEVIVDASRYFTQAKHLEIYGAGYFIREWGGSINAWTDMPLAPFIYGMLFKLFGESRIVVQAFNSFLFSMTVLITYLTGKRIWDEERGLYAGLMLLGIPYLFSQTPLMLVDVPTMFFLTLSVYTVICALEKGGAWIPVAAAAMFCAFFVKYSTWMMLTVIPVIFFIYLINGREAIGDGRWERRIILYRGLITAAIAGVLIGTVVTFKYDVISSQITFLREYQAPGLRRWGETFASTFLFQVHPFITCAALVSIYTAVKKRDPKFLIVSWLILLIVAFQIRRSRYVLIAFPMLALMASYGLQTIREKEMKRFVVSCAVAASLAVSLLAFKPFLGSMSMVNFKDAGGFLDTLQTEGVEVYTVYSPRTIVNHAVAVPILDLFTDKEIIYHHNSEFRPPFKKIEKSPLRFTWEYENPEYYSPDNNTSADAAAIAVISNGLLKELPEGVSKNLKGYNIAKVFNSSTRIFKYSPAVTVYIPVTDAP